MKIVGGGEAVSTPRVTDHHQHCPLSSDCQSQYKTQCYRPVPPSPVPYLLSSSLSFLLLFIFVCFVVYFPKLESLWLQRKEPCCLGVGGMGVCWQVHKERVF